MITRSSISVSSDNGAVRCSYDMRKPISTLAMSTAKSGIYKIGAAACLGDIKIIRVSHDIHAVSVTEQCCSSKSVTITDICWSSVDPMNLVASYSNGSISRFNLSEKVTPFTLTCTFDFDRLSTYSINRISCHPTEDQIIATASADGIVKLYDFRASKNISSQVLKFGQRGLGATKDVQFNPFIDNVFAEVSENGTLKIWDRRNSDKPVMSKMKAHLNHITSVSWHPSSHWILATGSKDKTAKVWDFSVCDYQVTVTPDKNSGEPLLLHTINASSEIGRLVWTPKSTEGMKLKMQLATISTTATSLPAAAPSGHISVWDVTKPIVNVPICVLKGHGVETCTSIQWLDGLLSSAASAPSSATAATASTSSKSKKAKPKEGVSQSGKSQPSAYFVLSGGKDGKLLIQDLSLGYHPLTHANPTVTAISSQGHVSFHRSGSQQVAHDYRY